MELIVSHLQVKFGEYLGALHTFQHLVNAWQGKAIFYCDVIELLIVDDWSTCAILFPYEEEGGHCWYIWRSFANKTSPQHGIPPGGPVLSLLCIKVVRLCWFQ